jgi:hypothetical protein
MIEEFYFAVRGFLRVARFTVFAARAFRLCAGLALGAAGGVNIAGSFTLGRLLCTRAAAVFVACLTVACTLLRARRYSVFARANVPSMRSPTMRIVRD